MAARLTVLPARQEVGLSSRRPDASRLAVALGHHTGGLVRVEHYGGSFGAEGPLVLVVHGVPIDAVKQAAGFYLEPVNVEYRVEEYRDGDHDEEGAARDAAAAAAGMARGGDAVRVGSR